MIGSPDSRKMCIEANDGSGKLIVSFVQIISDKTATTLKSTALVTYQVHAILLVFSAERQLWLIDGGSTLVGFLSVRSGEEGADGEGGGEDEDMSEYRFTSSMTTPLERGRRIIAGRRWRNQWLRALHGAMKVVLRPLWESELASFLVETRALVEWNCVPLMMSYCRDIPEREEISEMQYGVAVYRPCIPDMVTIDDILSNELACERSLNETGIVASRVLDDTKRKKSNFRSENEENAKGEYRVARS